MISFVNMMASDIWTEADISSRVQALIRAEVSAEDELKAARLSRKAAPSASESAFVERVDGVIASAVEQGRQARADMALLLEVLALEAGTLAMESASEKALDLYAVRHPVQPAEVPDGL